LVSFFVFFGVLAASADPSPTQLPVQKVGSAVFEVVVPKVDDTFIRYERTLPVEKLPYSVRNDHFISLGTAFAVAPNRFVSGAHVFALPTNSRGDEFYLRDQNGKTYLVSRVLKYSTDRDLIEFEVKQPPPTIQPLVFASAAVGDTVYVVGNALGEGISYRDGIVSSFTPEEIKNRWKFIRFSAAASPGNSGGPLVNAKGEVIGVVLRKNATENLNYAIPVSELSNVSDQKAEFVSRAITMTRGAERQLGDWSASFALPGTIFELEKESKKSLRQFVKKLWDSTNDLEDKRFPPASPKWRAYLRYPDLKTGISLVEYNTQNSKWFLSSIKMTYTTIDDEKYQNARFGTQEVVFLENAKKEKTKDLLSNPVRVMDRILKVVNLSRNFAGEKIRMLSLGKPKSLEEVKDGLQRTWKAWLWESAENQIDVRAYCLPTPSGALCLFSYNPLQDVFLSSEESIRRGLSYLLTSYVGTLEEWKDFLQMGSDLVPDAFRNVNVLKKQDVELQIAGHPVHFSRKDLTPESRMSIRMAYSPHVLLAQEVESVSITPIKDGTVYGVYSASEPLPDSSEDAKTHWENMLGKKKRFDGKPLINKGWTEISLLYDDEFVHHRIKQKFHAFCAVKSEKPDASYASDCNDFYSQVKIQK